MDEPVYRLPPDWELEPSITPLAEVVDPFKEFLGVEELQKKTAGKVSGRPVVYAVLDTGCDLKHRDLQNQIVDARDFTRSVWGPDDRHGHGTWCCGCIAAAADDFGVRGVAYDGKLLVGKVLGDNGSGGEGMIATGMKWAYDKGADIFSLSLGGGVMSSQLHGLFSEISQQRGKFIFCAAGNDGGTVNYPAAWPEVLAVGAVDKDGRLTRFTSKGPELDILAPGVAIMSTIPGNRHGAMTGTSMATPIAAAIGGLIWADAVNLGRGNDLDSVEEMLTLLRRTGRIGNGNPTDYPLIDPRALAKQFAVPAVPPPAAGGPAGLTGITVFINGVGWKATGWTQA